HDGEAVAVVEGDVEGAADEGVIEALGDAAAGLQDLAFDEVFLTVTGLVVDRRGAEDRVAIGADLTLPRPVAGLGGEAQIDALVLGGLLAERLEAGGLDAQAEVVVRTVI